MGYLYRSFTMNPIVLSLSLALACAAGLPTIVSAQSITVTTACGAGPVMYRYDLPRHPNGDIALTNSLELPSDGLPTIERVGNLVCLAEDQEDIHVLNVGYGPGIAMPTYEDMIAIALILEGEATGAAGRAFDFMDTQEASG